MIYFYKTVTGVKNKINQDYISSYTCDNAFIFSVCDGMGGGNHGEVASKKCSQLLQKYISQLSNFNSLKGDIKKLIKKVNLQLYNYANSYNEYTGMGTTLVLCVIINKKAYVANVGDSRLYLFRANVLKQITEDHSKIWELYKKGLIKKHEIIKSPIKNIITKAVATKNKVSPDIFELDLKKDDVLLLCSDGLTDVTCDEIIKDILQNNSLQDVPDMLYKKALSLGSKDDITTLVIKI